MTHVQCAQVIPSELGPIAEVFADRDEAIKHGIIVQGMRFEVSQCNGRSRQVRFHNLIIRPFFHHHRHCSLLILLCICTIWHTMPRTGF